MQREALAMLYPDALVDNEALAPDTGAAAKDIEQKEGENS